MFDTLSSDIYWLKVKQAAICVNHLTIHTEKPAGNPGQPDSTPSRELCKAELADEMDRIPVLAPDRSSAGKSSPSLSRPSGARNRAKIIEEICLSDTSSAGDSESDSDDSLPDLSRGASRSRRRRHRKVARPQVFQPDGWQSLRQFFSSYERYFHSEFEGSSRDCPQELANFLPAEMRSHFEAVGGRRLRYDDMKAEMISWYKSHKNRNTKYWRDQLASAQMNSGESLKLYAIRLLKLGQKAYPHSDYDCLREIRQHYLDTVPREFSEHLARGEELFCTTGRAKKFKWAHIMKLAEKEDTRNRGKLSDLAVAMGNVNLTTPQANSNTAPVNALTFPIQEDSHLLQGDGAPNTPQALFTPRSPQATQSQRRSRGAIPKNRPSRENAKLPCPWCGKVGHDIDSCWTRQGACLLCGSMMHPRERCPKFNPHFIIEPKLVCPICYGQHLGKDCTINSSQLN